MKTPNREEAVVCTIDEVANRFLGNVLTSISAERCGRLVVRMYCEQSRLYSTPHLSGEAKTLEPSDITAAMHGLDFARRWMNSTSKTCRFYKRWPHGFKPVDFRDEPKGAAPNLRHQCVHGNVTTQVFQNGIVRGYVAYKIEQFRKCEWGKQSGVTKTLLGESISDALFGLSDAKKWISAAQRDLWVDYSHLEPWK